MTAGAVVTVPPHAPFAEAVARHPLTRGLRLNTVFPTEGAPGEVLARLARLGPPLWIDLKGRQLRVAEAAVPPFTEVRLSHPIRLQTPAVALFGDGREAVRVLAADGDRLILEDGPRRVLGPGESVNIPDPSLRVEGTLTPRDRAFVAAARELGLHDYLLSFVEDEDDVAELRRLDPGARVRAKVESRRGLSFARERARAADGLVAARGDLYLEVERPHRLLPALRDVLRADPTAWAASRILDGLAWDEEPRAQDVTDAAFLLQLGYRTLVLGDEVCLRRDSVLAALDLLEAIVEEAGAEAPQRAAVGAA